MNVIKTVLWIVVCPGFILIWVPNEILNSELALPHEIEWASFLGLIPITLGIIIYVFSAMDFVKVGKGTPIPINPPRNLVSSRLYGIVRNPFYVGAVLIVLGESIFFTSFSLFIYALFLWWGLHLLVVLFEEPILRRKFGDSYKKYCNETPRWIPLFSRISVNTLKAGSDKGVDKKTHSSR